MSDVRPILNKMLEHVANTLNVQVQQVDCPAATLAVAIKLLKDNGVEARATKGSPLGNLAESLPKFDDSESDEPPLQH